MANHYLFTCKNPQNNILQIQFSFESCDDEKLILRLPTWRPGRYETANFSKNIYQLSVEQVGNKDIEIRKISKCQWEITKHKHEERITIFYDFYAHTMDAGNSWVDNEMWYINFVNCCISLLGKENQTHTLTLDIPSDYTIACSLTQKGSILVANSFETLIDSPVIASANIQKHIFKQNGCDFYIWIQGNIKPDWQKIEKNFRAYTQAQVDIFGDFPCSDYHYLFHILPYKHYHGVEHPNSTVITLGPDIKFNDFYDDFLGISSHELFHTWNIKRIRPKELSPYPLFSEPAFETGYIAEGITTYYGDLMLKRSDVFTSTQYLKELNKTFKKHFENYGRHRLSLADSSCDLWADGYKPSAPHRKVSIYTKGAIISLILDLRLRLKGYSLDDVMREFWKQYPNPHQGYTSQDYLNIIEKITGESHQKYYADYIQGTVPVEEELAILLPQFGCSFEAQEHPDFITSRFGIKVNVQNKISEIAPNSPAYKQLSVGDIILNKEEITNTKSSELKINRYEKELIIKISKTKFTYYNTFKIEINEANNTLLTKWLGKISD